MLRCHHPSRYEIRPHLCVFGRIHPAWWLGCGSMEYAAHRIIFFFPTHVANSLQGFCRTISLHLQICWNVVPGRKFFYITLVLGWIIPFFMIAIALAISGVSYRFGSICHINHESGLEDFWGPLLAVSAASLIIHVGTLAYCIHIYVRSVMEDSPATEGTSSHHTPYSGSAATLSARHTYRRVKSVVQLQWRGIATILTILGNVIYFAIIFLRLDKTAQKTPENTAKQKPWIGCLIDTGGDRFACAEEGGSFGPNEAATIAVLIMLAMSGLWTVLFLGHLSILRACYDFIKQKVLRRDEFVSMDARGNGTHSRATYEMYGSNPMKSPEPLLSASPTDMSSSTFYNPQYSPAKEVDQPSGLARDARYRSPALSFSSPRPPSATRQPSFGRDWDPASTFARGDAGSRGPHRNHSYSRSRHS